MKIWSLIGQTLNEEFAEAIGDGKPSQQVFKIWFVVGIFGATGTSVFTIRSAFFRTSWYLFLVKLIMIVLLQIVLFLQVHPYLGLGGYHQMLEN